MLSLLRRDPAFGAPAVLWCGVGFLLNGVITGLVVMQAARIRIQPSGIEGSPAWLTLVIWLSISLFLLFGKSRDRCRAFDLGLPVSARRLWLAHVLALTLLGLGFLALTVGMLELLFWIVGRPTLDLSPLQWALVDLISPLIAVLILVVVLLQSPRPSFYRIPGNRTYTLYSILLIASSAGLVTALSSLPAITALLPLILAVLVAIRSWHSVPAAFVLAPFEPDAKEAAVQAGQAARHEWEEYSGRTKGLGLQWFLFRCFYLKPGTGYAAAFFFFPLFLGWGVVLSGFFTAWKGLELPQFSYVILTGYLLVSWLPAQAQRYHGIVPLPISGRNLFAILILPGFLTIALGCGAGMIGALLPERSQLQVVFTARDSGGLFPSYPFRSPTVRVPAGYCSIAWDGSPPETESPWGESHPVRVFPLYKGSRAVVYSLFSTPEDSSPRFVALQISRAIQDVYGLNVPYQEVLDHYLEVRDNKAVALKQGGRLILEDHPGLRVRGRIALYPVLMLGIGAAWLIGASIYFRACRATVSEGGRKIVYLVLLAVGMGSVVAQVAIMVAGLIRPDIAAAVLRIFLRELARTLPGGNLSVWIVCGLLSLAFYLPVRAWFRHVELLPPRAAEGSASAL
jgi:hypothetical protein